MENVAGSNIKLCPFCGGNVKLDELDIPNVYFECEDCGVSIVFKEVFSDAEAIEKYNRRV